MWQDYEASYRDALRDPAFLAWRESGARRKAENIARVCAGVSPFSVVEIGCGTGAVLRLLHAMNFAREYCCIDLSPAAVEFARHSCPAFLHRAVAGRADALPFATRTFDVAILSHVIEHLDEPVAALAEASRVARFVVVEVPTEKVLNNFVRTKMLGQPYPSIRDAGHVQFWSPSSIVAFLQQAADLEIVNRHRDLLAEDIGSGVFANRGVHGARPLLKRALRSCLPGSVYARVLTTHATFLCRRPESNTGSSQLLPNKEQES